jgi:putative methionine-R-sulfoxide reductase with GAF domain
MPAVDVKGLPDQETLRFLDLADLTLTAKSLGELGESVLPLLAGIMGVPAALLYLEDPRLLSHFFSHTGLQAEVIAPVEGLCALQFHQSHAGMQYVSVTLGPEKVINLSLFPLQTQKGARALLGLTWPRKETLFSSILVGKVLSLLSHALDNLLDRADVEKRNRYLKAYMTMSSMIAQSLDLHELLETILHCSKKVVSAEAASILLLDDDKANFEFYIVRGPSKPLLEAVTFPADKGIAGAILQKQRSEVINDVQADPRFFGKFDQESGFVTRNMIAMPLTAGEEKIGVLEVINKAGGEPFNEEERQLLQCIAAEIAFTIRNARMFDFVATLYCQQRQGRDSCEGCRKPLGSWTPCTVYRQRALSG